ncbi:capsule biosynthesis protein [Celeribacter neptunius]|uniref:Capsular polysaccharide export protein n=1 Tax=Celeribacter neptunius TaxID=588602 RepID=A0A1I3IPJ0_9RHOB|nr:capsular biosynthesis protein [Celeribacter neptunius]SFI49905.1 capsular polysaccharide export protein [Celeribacter neptunius]
MSHNTEMKHLSPSDPPASRVFLMLQGPHGPYFWGLGKMLRAAGAAVWRVGFNAGDRAFWFSSKSFLPYTGTPEAWPETFAEIVANKGVTDIVLYGDTRPVHALAIEKARALGLTIHVFEEGYIRPYWVSYERDGSNGNSSLMGLSVEDMRVALDKIDQDNIEPPAQWGDMRQHIFYGALYHWFVLFRNGAFKHFKGHRELPVTREFLLYFKRLILMPQHYLSRGWHTRRILNAGHPFHIALLQLEHDTSFQVHSPYSTMPEFIADVIQGFATGAPAHHHLVFKAHPLENDRRNLRHEIRRISAEYGVEHRVHYVRGGKLQRLLHSARSAVTVNSTAGQQVLSLGIPLRILGQAVYDKPEFVSHQPLEEFFSHPDRPDTRAYRDFRQFLLETSQVPGGFYSKRGRQQLLRLVVDLMLSQDAPDVALLSGTAPPRQPLRLVK